MSRKPKVQFISSAQVFNLAQSNKNDQLVINMQKTNPFKSLDVLTINLNDHIDSILDTNPMLIKSDKEFEKFIEKGDKNFLDKIEGMLTDEVEKEAFSNRRRLFICILSNDSRLARNFAKEYIKEFNDLFHPVTNVPIQNIIKKYKNGVTEIWNYLKKTYEIDNVEQDNIHDLAIFERLEHKIMKKELIAKNDKGQKIVTRKKKKANTQVMVNGFSLRLMDFKKDYIADKEIVLEVSEEEVDFDNQTSDKESLSDVNSLSDVSDSPNDSQKVDSSNKNSNAKKSAGTPKKVGKSIFGKKLADFDDINSDKARSGSLRAARSISNVSNSLLKLSVSNRRRNNLQKNDENIKNSMSNIKASMINNQRKKLSGTNLDVDYGNLVDNDKDLEMKSHHSAEKSDTKEKFKRRRSHTEIDYENVQTFLSKIESTETPEIKESKRRDIKQMTYACDDKTSDKKHNFSIDESWDKDETFIDKLENMRKAMNEIKSFFLALKISYCLSLEKHRENYIVRDGAKFFLERYPYILETHSSMLYKKINDEHGIPNEILPNQIWLGNSHHALSHNIVIGMDITHVLNITTEVDCPFDSYGVTYLKVPVHDYSHTIIWPYFKVCYEFIERHSYGRQLIHCVLGRSRSCTIQCMYLMKKFNLSYVEANETQSEKRQSAQINLGFEAQLVEFENNNYEFSKESVTDLKDLIIKGEIQT